MKGNRVKALQQLAETKQITTIKQVLAAIVTMIEKKEPIDFQTVAQKSGVHVSSLYRNEGIKILIKSLNEKA